MTIEMELHDKPLIVNTKINGKTIQVIVAPDRFDEGVSILFRKNDELPPHPFIPAHPVVWIK